jgi:hypothetical protein
MPATKKPESDADSIIDQQADEIAVLKHELWQKNDDLERKNRALEGFIAENEALKEELGGRRKKTPANGPNQQNELTARIERWRESAKGNSRD